MTLWLLWSTDDTQNSSACANDKHHKAIHYLIINLSINISYVCFYIILNMYELFKKVVLS